MIARFNTSQILRGLLSLVLSAVAYALTFAFFYYSVQFVAANFHYKAPVPFAFGIPIACLAVVTATGVIRWRSGIGHYGYDTMDPFSQFEPTSGGSFMMAHYASRVTGPAYLITQIALAAPFQFLEALARFRSLVPLEPGLEKRLTDLLSQIRSVGKWQEMTTYLGHEREIAILIQMRLVEFSPRTGKLKTR